MMAWNEAICRRLEDQATQIEKVLARHGISAVVTGGVFQAETCDFWLQVSRGQLNGNLAGVEGEMAAVLGVSEVQIARQGERMTVRVMAPDSFQKPLNLVELVDSVAEERPLTMIFGVSEEGRPLLLHLPTADVSNILIVGDDGAGKTSLLRTILYSLAARNKQHHFQAAVIDFNPDGQPGPMAAFSYLPHLVEPVAASLPQAIEVLAFLEREMRYRQHSEVTYPRIVVVIDNLDELLQAGQNVLMARLIQLLQCGAEVGIHLILALTYPGGEFVDKILKCDFPLRFIGRVENEKLARAGAGIFNTGAEMLAGGGNFVAVHAGRTCQFRTATISDYDLYLAVEKLSRQKKRRIVVGTAVLRLPVIP